MVQASWGGWWGQDYHHWYRNCFQENQWVSFWIYKLIVKMLLQSFRRILSGKIQIGKLGNFGLYLGVLSARPTFWCNFLYGLIFFSKNEIFVSKIRNCNLISGPALGLRSENFWSSWRCLVKTSTSILMHWRKNWALLDLRAQEMQRYVHSFEKLQNTFFYLFDSIGGW